MQEICEFLGVVALAKVEIDAVVHFFNVDCVAVCRVLQDELFQIEKRPLVGHLLSYLYACSPGIVCVALLTVWALLVCLHKLDLKRLL